MNQRGNKACLVIGMRNAGKTFFARQIITSYQKKFPAKKILVIDTLDHPDYRDIPVISLDMIPRWKSANVYRIFGSNTEEILLEAEKLYNSLVICEDASKYIEANLQPHIKTWVIDSKQKNTDIIFLFHGFSFVAPKLWRICDLVTVFKTDDPSYRKTEIVNYAQVKSAWDHVMNSKDPHAKITVNIY